MGRVILLGLRALQVALAVTNLALSAYVVDWYISGTRTSSPSIFNFLVFAPVFSLVSIIYLETIPRFAPRGSHPWASMGIEAVNSVFYFAGFIALAVFISKLIFCNGTVCAAGKADAVISALQFVAWIASTILMAKDLFKGGLRQPAAPPMQQA